MTYRVRFHPAVPADLAQIADYLRPIAGRKSTRKIVEELQAKALSLSNTPHRGSRRDDIVSNLRAIPSGKKGVVIFRIDEAERCVDILMFAYAGYNWTDHVSARTKA